MHFKMVSYFISYFHISYSWFFLYPVKDYVNFQKTQVLFHHLLSILTCQFTLAQSAGQRGEAPSL